MTRLVYNALLWLHPKEFRERFGAEMLCVFDEMGANGQTGTLFGDAILSLLRQWLLRSGSWKAVAAVLLAFAQVTTGGLIFLSSMRSGLAPGRADMKATGDVTDSIQLMLWTAGSIVLLVTVTALWVRAFTRRIARG